MSLNQSRSDKSETTQYRKTGRSGSSGQQRGFQGAGSGKGGGGVPTGPPPISSSSSSYSSRSFKKSNNNAQGGQSRVSGSSLISESSNASAVPRGVQNGAHGQPPLHGASDAPVTSGAVRTTDSSTQKSARPDPKAASVHSAAAGADASAPTTPAKGDGSRGFAFQFGSLSPGLMNGMQIPARTSSAPPNLDEQKRDQARHDSYRAAPAVPIPSVPKQHLPRKDTGAADQSNSVETHPVSKSKRETHISSLPPATQTQKPSVHTISGMSMQMPFHQPQVSVQFGGPNPQMQPQGLTVPMQMPLPIGSAPQVQQQMFVPSLQHHSMQAQGIIPQGQGMSSMGFTTQMGPQLTPQIGNLGMSISPQYPQQQAGKFGGTRKSIKITDPKTHKELRLDKRAESYLDGGSSGMRSHSNATPQSQPIPSFPPINYYTNSYNSGVYFQAPSSVPLTSPITSSSQAPRFNYSVSQGPQTVPYVNTSALNSSSTNKTGTATHESLNLEPSVVSSAPSPTIQVTVKPASVSVGEKVGYSSPSIGSPAVEKGESPRLLRPTGEGSLNNPQRDSEICSESFLQQSKPGHEPPTPTSLPVASKETTVAAAAISVESPASNALSSAPPAPPAASEESTTAAPNTEAKKKESLSRSNSMKDQQKKPGRKGHLQPQNQVNPSASISTLPSQPLEHGISFNDGVPESVEAKAATTTATLALSKACESVLESSEEQKSTIHGPAMDASETKATKADSVRSACKLSEITSSEMIEDTVVPVLHVNQDNFQNEQDNEGTVGTGENDENILSEGIKRDDNRFELSSESVSSKSLGNCKQTEEDVVLKDTAIGSGVGSLEISQRELEEPVGCYANDDGLGNDLGVSASTTADSVSAEIAQSNLISSAISDADGASYLDASSSRSNSMGCKADAIIKSGTSNQDSDSVLASCPSEPTLKHEGEGADNVGSVSGHVSAAVSSPKDKPAPEMNRSKSTLSRGKKKRKEILQKADALGTTSDLYMAYKGPEEKKETAISSESTESTSSANLKQLPDALAQDDIIASERSVQSKAEPDDWEDAADISTPKLETSNDREQVRRGVMHYDEDGNTNLAKKYSRDFLQKFSDQCTDLPDDFVVKSEIEALMVLSTAHFSDRESYSSPGRIIDRPSVGSRLDRRGSGALDDDKWGKLPGNYSLGRDMRLDIGYGGNIGGLRPGQGGSHGVLRNPRAQASVQYVGGILSGPMQSLGPQGGMQRNNPGPDAERWQRATGFQKGLIPSPQTPLQVMHRAEKKYEVGKVTDEEQAKQRQLKAILNKLTPQNFEKLFEQVKAVNIDNAVTLTGVISQIFDKALMEPTFCEMYANFCSHLSAELPDFSEDNEKITFKRLLLNKCQEEFERGEREQEEANRVEEEGEIKQSEEEREEKRIKARRRMLGNIRLIGELYKKKMLTERIMHECIKKLLGQHQTPEEEDVEALCKLMSTIGEMIDHPKAKVYMDAYFDRMADLSNNMELSSRVRFMLKDAIDLRKNKWQQRRKVEGPKKIDEVHRDAAQERQAQASRLARGPGINPSARRVQPMDFGSRGSTMVPSPNAQIGGYRGLPTHARGFGTQDVRVDDRHPYEGRPLSVPLSQRPMGDESITLGPQGGLARGMSIRGQPSMSTAPLADISPSSNDPRRLTAGLNGYSSVPERTAFNSREDLIPRYMPERFAYDQSGTQERNMPLGSRDVRSSDRSLDRSHAASSHTQVQGTVLAQSVSSEKVWPEERLRDMSIAAIKEFYSAKDEKEVALCVKDLNSPGFHPTMISIWVTDSFERKDMERDLLAKLLVNLTRSQDGVLSHPQLIKGFEAVLMALEDAVNDAPKAAEFLGRIFAWVILENVISLRDIGRLVYEGGEERGNLRKVGLAAEILGSTLEIIKTERGDSVLNEIRTSSNLRLEDFKHSDPYRSRKLAMFI